MPIISGGSSGGASPAIAQAFDSTLGAPAATIDTGAGGIPAGWTALLLGIRARSAKAAVTNDGLGLVINADAGANQQAQWADASQTSAGQHGDNAVVTSFEWSMPAATAPASVWGSAFLVIHGYADTQFQQVLGLSGSVWAVNVVHGSPGYLSWNSAAPITRLAVKFAADNLLAGSRLTVWTLK